MGSHKAVTRADAHAPGEVADYVDFTEVAAPATPASGFVRVYTKSDGKLYIKDDAGTETDLTSSGGAGATVPQWMEYLAARQSGETSHADDDFFDDASAAGTAVTPAGTVVWTEQYDVLSVRADSQGAADICGRMFALTPSTTPVTIETAFFMPPFYGSTGTSEFGLAGLAFADGTTSTDDYAGAVCIQKPLADGTLFFRGQGGPFNNGFATAGTAYQMSEHGSPWGLLYMRVIWSAANTFEFAVSADGVTWVDYGDTGISRTMTPTHFGPIISARNGDAGEFVLASFQYLRVYETDLSV